MISYTLTALTLTGAGISTGTVNPGITSHKKTSVHSISVVQKERVSFAYLTDWGLWEKMNSLRSLLMPY
jgi:hypothetical protein